MSLPAVPTANASTSPFPVPDLSHEHLTALLVEQVVESQGRNIVDGGYQEFDRWYTIDPDLVTMIVRDIKPNQLYVERRAMGFPFHFIAQHRAATEYMQLAMDISPLEPRSWFHFAVRFKGKPYARINLLAFTTNTAIFATLFLAIIATCGIIRCSRRLHRRRCVKCNYDTSAHPHVSEFTCPECGFRH
ncbi:MAG: hypothetical protein ACTS3F_08905 [Phycisphaerales bacterium]